MTEKTKAACELFAVLYMPGGEQNKAFFDGLANIIDVATQECCETIAKKMDRDGIALHILQGLVKQGSELTPPSMLTDEAYRFADAFIRRRDKKPMDKCPACAGVCRISNSADGAVNKDSPWCGNCGGSGTVTPAA